MDKPDRRYPKPLLAVAGLAFGAYLSLGLAYFETFPPGGLGDFWTYLSIGAMFSAVCVFLGLKLFGGDALPLSAFRQYLLPIGLLVLSGFAAFLIGGLTSGAALRIDLLGQVFFHLLLVGLLPVLAALILVPQPGRPPAAEKPQPSMAATAAPPASQQMIVIEGMPGEVLLSIPADQLIAVEAADNYCKFHFFQGSQRKTKLIRLTMKEGEERVLKAAVFHRCHRSFLVNPGMVEEIRGVSQAYRLRMKGMEELVPVSRAFDIQLLGLKEP